MKTTYFVIKGIWNSFLKIRFWCWGGGGSGGGVILFASLWRIAYENRCGSPLTKTFSYQEWFNSFMTEADII